MGKLEVKEENPKREGLLPFNPYLAVLEIRVQLTSPFSNGLQDNNQHTVGFFLFKDRDYTGLYCKIHFTVLERSLTAKLSFSPKSGQSGCSNSTNFQFSPTNDTLTLGFEKSPYLFVNNGTVRSELSHCGNETLFEDWQTLIKNSGINQIKVTGFTGFSEEELFMTTEFRFVSG